MDIAGEGEGFRVHVNGLYEFHNSGDGAIKGTIFYPFPLADGAEYPDAIRVSRRTEGGGLVEIPFTRNRAGISFAISLEPKRDLALRVDYSQHTAIGRATYILSTTAVWGRPLEVAEFEVRLPSQYHLERLSYPPDRIERKGKKTVYTIRRIDFMPAEDLEVYWVVPTGASSAGDPGPGR